MPAKGFSTSVLLRRMFQVPFRPKPYTSSFQEAVAGLPPSVAVRIVVHAAVGEVAVNVHAVSSEQVAVVTLVEGQHQAVLVRLELLVRGVEATEGLAEGRAGYPVFRPGVVQAYGITAALVVKAGGSPWRRKRS